MTNLALNYKNIDSVLGTQTRGGRMVGIDESTELWRHPMTELLYLFHVKLHVYELQLWQVYNFRHLRHFLLRERELKITKTFFGPREAAKFFENSTFTPTGLSTSRYIVCKKVFLFASRSLFVVFVFNT